MTEKVFSKRINAIIDSVGICETAADVGCDHGQIGVGVLSRQKTMHLYFCDISKKCLEKSKLLCAKNGFLESAAKSDEACKRMATCSFHCMDGLGGLQPETVIIAGMGGMEIASILKKSAKISNLVLQPQKNIRELRLYLTEDYDFISEKVVYDGGKFYSLMLLKKKDADKAAESGDYAIDEFQAMFGVNAIVDDDYVNSLMYRLKEIDYILRRTAAENLIKEKRLLETYLNDILGCN